MAVNRLATAGPRAWVVWLRTILGAVAANLVVRAAGLAAFDVPPEFEPLATAGPTVFLTVVGVAAGLGVAGRGPEAVCSARPPVPAHRGGRAAGVARARPLDAHRRRRRGVSGRHRRRRGHPHGAARRRRRRRALERDGVAAPGLLNRRTPRLAGARCPLTHGRTPSSGRRCRTMQRPVASVLNSVILEGEHTALTTPLHGSRGACLHRGALRSQRAVRGRGGRPHRRHPEHRAGCLGPLHRLDAACRDARNVDRAELSPAQDRTAARRDVFRFRPGQGLLEDSHSGPGRQRAGAPILRPSRLREDRRGQAARAATGPGSATCAIWRSSCRSLRSRTAPVPEAAQTHGGIGRAPGKPSAAIGGPATDVHGSHGENGAGAF